MGGAPRGATADQAVRGPPERPPSIRFATGAYSAAGPPPALRNIRHLARLELAIGVIDILI